MKYINHLKEAIEKHHNNNAFCIQDTFFTYHELATEVSIIRLGISATVKDSDKIIGLILNDDLKTYAAIIALWLEGKAYLPINPEHPDKRNKTILSATGASFIFDSTNSVTLEGFITLPNENSKATIINLSPKQTSSEDLAYILFTSGSTGEPKGVPITHGNLNAYINAINYDGEFKLEETDRCLQMFELTFDFSVVSYIFPLLAGSCIYTVPRNSIKYFYIFKLMQNYKLTVLSLVPSIIHYLKPYFSEINATEVRYCSFGGGALYNDIIEEWYKCIPNGIMFNYYGPTENTIYSSAYKIEKDCSKNITHNGIISIGKPLNDVNYFIVDKNFNEVPDGTTGELVLASPQLTPGYWKNPKKNKEAFFFKTFNHHDKNKLRFYRTGDLCFKQETGHYMYLGRIDFQVKIRGFRIELSEVEFHAKAKAKEKVNMVAIDVLNHLGNAELALAIESEAFNTEAIENNMKAYLPDYMIPDHIKFIKEFPYNTNGKIDRNQLRNHFNITKND